MVNLKMIEDGLATIYMLKEDETYGKIFRSAEKMAVSSRRGIWASVSEATCSECIFIKEFNWNAEGNDCENPNGEWVVFKNICDYECNLTGWFVKDSGRNKYKFLNFILESRSSVKLFSGAGNDTEDELYWDKKGSCKALWDNDGDTLYLRDGEEGLVLKERYEKEWKIY